MELVYKAGRVIPHIFLGWMVFVGDLVVGADPMLDLPGAGLPGEKAVGASNGVVAPSKGLLRFRERLAEWKLAKGKGGWSNRSGKILSCGKDVVLTLPGLTPRALAVGEAIQAGGGVEVGPSGPLFFQSGPGIFHRAEAGTILQIAPLEKGQKDVKLILEKGTIFTAVGAALVAPRLQILGLGNGLVGQSGDGLYRVVRGTEEGLVITVAAGQIRLVEEAGAGQVAEVKAGSELHWPGEKVARNLEAGTPEVATLKQVEADAGEAYLLDMMRDAIKSAAGDTEEIVRDVSQASPATVLQIAKEAVANRPDLYDLICQASGVTDLPRPSAVVLETQAFGKRAIPWLKGQPSPLDRFGKVVYLEGKVTRGDGLPVARGDILRKGEVVKTSGDGRVLFLSAAGVMAEIQPGSEVALIEMQGLYEEGNLIKGKTVLEVKQGRAFCSIVGGQGKKIQVEVRTPQGVVRGESSNQAGVNTEVVEL